ncbi:MAG: beta-ketoacyl-ACP synthase III [Steroidobacteraceae bacterium]
MMYAQIVGTGAHLPEKVVTNFDLERMMDTTDAWIRDRTGIERRHIAADHETTVDLSEPAARRALEAAGMSPQDVDCIVFATSTPDYIFPNCGVLLQQRLGCRTGGPAFSVEAACSGFLYALAIADKFVRTGDSKCALVVGSETFSRITDWTDRSTAILFADGAGAVVLRPSERPGILSTHLHADGNYKDMLYCPGGVSRATAAFAQEEGRRAITMAGNEVFKVAVTSLGKVVDEALAVGKLDRSAIDWLVPHQANIRIIQATARKLELPMERVIVTVQEHGNTSAASVPLALDVGVRDGRIKRGDLLLLEAFGGGATWGAALVRY